MLNSISVHKVILFKLLLKAGFVQAHSSNPVTCEWDEPMPGVFEGILQLRGQGKSMVRKGGDR